MANYAKITPCDMSNGTGIRVSIFFSGCYFQCKNCFNKELWDFNYGQVFTNETIDKIIELLKPDYIAGLSILGGEPLHNTFSVRELVMKVKEIYPEKNIWLWTGYDLGEIGTDSFTAENILCHVDYLVTGRYVDKLRDLTLKFRGSSNQKIWHNNNGKWEIIEE